MFKQVIAVGAAVSLAIATYFVYTNKQKKKTAEVEPESFKQQWVFTRKNRIQEFQEMFETNLINKHVSIIDFNLDTFNERYLKDLSVVSLKTTEGFMLLAKVTKGKAEWAFMPPNVNEIYGIHELSDYLASVKNNQSTTLFTG